MRLVTVASGDGQATQMLQTALNPEAQGFDVQRLRTPTLSIPESEDPVFPKNDS